METTQEKIKMLREEIQEEINGLIGYYTVKDNVAYAGNILGLQEAYDVVSDKLELFIAKL